MLLKIAMIRMLPFLLLKLCRERKTVKLTFTAVVTVSLLLSAAAVYGLIRMEGIGAILCLLPAMLPHSVCYLFACWLLFRCIWKEWSRRVWRRIFCLSFLITAAGILMETYWNPPVLKFFQKISELLF